MLLNGCLESIFIEISFDEKKNIIVGLIYRHPHMQICDNFLIEYLNKIALLDNTCILMGDFNIGLLKSSCYLVFYIQQPTRVVGSSATLIDNIFMNSVKFVTVSGSLFLSLLKIYCNSLSLKISEYLTGQNVNKYSNVIMDFSITMNLKTKLIK